MKLLPQIPEQPIKEEWRWLTDVMTSDNAKEQRICNSDLPKRIHNLSVQFDNADDLRAHFSGMVFGSKEAFQVPLYQYSTRLKASAGAGTTTLSIVSARSELRIGGDCLVYDSSGYELHTIQDMDSTSVTLTVGLARVFGLRASICPVTTVVSANSAALNLGILDHDAKATLNLNETGFIDPFVNPFNSSALTMLNGLPVLTSHPIGPEFPVQFDTGKNVTDEGGVVQVRSPWAYARLIMSRSFLCERVFDRADFERWFLFADAVKGSWKAFYMPSYRADFALAAAPVPAGASLTFTGVSYHDEYFPYEAFKGVAIFHANGVHYAQVTACAIAGTDSQVTFDPPLPADAGEVDRVTLLLKVRIADDKMSWQHFSLYSQVDLTLRTIEE